MAALREIVASFAIQVDDKPLTALDKRIKKVNEELDKMSTYAAAGLAALGVVSYKMVDLASKAEENMNVVNQTFKGSAAEIVDWSKTIGEHVGRSQFTLQEYAGQLGAFLAPKFPVKETAEYTKMLTKLSVDLASFYNVSDEEAMQRILSGIAGETEAIRRFGVDISDTRLREDYEKDTGGKGPAYKTLSIAEKTTLRIEAIMRDTVDKQDDAARTAGSWENSLKRTSEKAKTLGVIMGQRLLPIAKTLLSYVEGFVEWSAKWLDKTQTLQAAFLTLSGVVAGLVGMKLAAWFVANTAAAGMLALAMVPVTAAFLAIEDILVFFSGGDSVLGKIVTFLTGATDPITALQYETDMWLAKVEDVLRTLRIAAEYVISPVAAFQKYGDKPFSGMFQTDAQDRMRGIWDQKAASAQEAWRRGVAAGDMSVTASWQTGRGREETEEQARERFQRERISYVFQNPEALMPADVARGIDALALERTAVRKFDPGTPEALRRGPEQWDLSKLEMKKKEVEKPAPAMSLAPGQGVLQVTNNVTNNINGAKDPKVLARELNESLVPGSGDKALRDASRATRDGRQ